LLGGACTVDNSPEPCQSLLRNGWILELLRMSSLLLEDEQERRKETTLGKQAVSFFGHALLALCGWIALMLVGYAVNPQNLSQMIILAASAMVPLLLGFSVNRVRQSEMATAVWLLGMTWFTIVAFLIVDMPTSPNQCFHCSLGEKLSRTFLSWPSPSGLIDDDGPFLGTWPAAALIGYAIGARLAMKKADAEA
jgi:amino acid transporter